MTELIPRKFHFDLTKNRSLDWIPNESFLSAMFIALSMYLPIGERYIMGSLGGAMKFLPQNEQGEKLKKEIKLFIQQESFHKSLHTDLNAIFEKNTTNKIEKWVSKRIQKHENDHIKGKVGLTMASEHTTLFLSHWVYNNPQFFTYADRDIADLLFWHCGEEIEHRATAFKVYHALGGTAQSRKKYLYAITRMSIWDILRQTMINLYYSKSLFKLKTWKDFYKYVLSKNGILRSNYHGWKAFFRDDYNPENYNPEASQSWLIKHKNLYDIV